MLYYNFTSATATDECVWRYIGKLTVPNKKSLFAMSGINNKEKRTKGNKQNTKIWARQHLTNSWRKITKRYRGETYLYLSDIKLPNLTSNLVLRRAEMTLSKSKQNCSWQYRTMSKFEVLKSFMKNDKNLRSSGLPCWADRLLDHITR